MIADLDAEDISDHIPNLVKATESMQIFVKTSVGSTTTLDDGAMDTIEIVEAKIPDCLGLTFAGQQLEKDRTLYSYNVLNESALTVCTGMQICVRTLKGETTHSLYWQRTSRSEWQTPLQFLSKVFVFVSAPVSIQTNLIF